jgi:hypothetical protein
MNTIARIVQAGDGHTSTERVGVTEAAVRLHTTAHSIRQRIRRGDLTAGREDGRWFVLLPAGSIASQFCEAGDDSEPEGSLIDLVEALQREMRILQQELEQRSDALRHHEHAISVLIRRLGRLPIPGDEAPTDASGTRKNGGPDRATIELLQLQAEAMEELRQGISAVGARLSKLESEWYRTSLHSNSA